MRKMFRLHRSLSNVYHLQLERMNLFNAKTSDNGQTDCLGDLPALSFLGNLERLSR